MAAIDDLKLRCTWLAQNVALACRGMNPPTAFAGNKKIEIGDPNNPVVDAVVDIYEPSTGARYPAVAGTHPSGAAKKSQTQIPMYHVDDGIPMTHMDVSQAMSSGEIPDVIGVTAAGIMEKLTNLMVPDLVAGFFQYAGAVDEVPSTSAHLRALASAVEDRSQGCYTPDDMRRVLLVEPAVNESLLGISEFVIASSVGEANTMKTGQLSEKYSFGQIKKCSYLTGVNSTAGTATGVLVNGTPAAGASSMSIDTAAGAGTVKIGSVFTVAGSTQRHVVRGKLSVSSTSYIGRMSFADITLANGVAQEMHFYPPLAAAPADNAAITFLATHGIAGLGFHPLAIATATRKFPDYAPGTGYVAGYAVDKELNLAYRVTSSADYMINRFAVDVCAGAAVVVPRFGARWIRTAN
jgi:hypothetical protein